MLRTIIALAFLSAGFPLFAQDLQLFTSRPDAEEKKFLYGIISARQITDDATFTWYAANAQYAKPQPAVVEAIKAGMAETEIVLFVGTWCHDTQQLLPKYFKTLEAAGYPLDSLTIFATDREKHTISNMHNVFRVINVPTIIVMKAGKEVGRVSEYGETGLVDQELGEIFKKLK